MNNDTQTDTRPGAETGGGPEGLSGTRICVSAGGREITLIGTAHVSRESIEEVRRAILEEKPDMVCVELDQGRYDAITNSSAWEKLDMVKVFREGKGFLLLANLALAGFQRRLGKELGVKPGEEMKTAVETARTLDIPYALCDREVQVTLRRAWSRCGAWDRAKLLSSLIAGAFTREKLSEAEIENLKNHSELEGMMNELAEFLPAVKRTLIDERDSYLAAKIWAAGGQRPLAVVGAGHMAGIKAELERVAAETAAAAAEAGVAPEAVGINLEGLTGIPPKRAAARLLPWLVPALIAGLIGWSVWTLGASASLSLLLRWVLWNGGLAALGAILALGHPLSVLAAFAGAPIATVNPLIGVGFFSGLAEAALRKPRVEDAQSINDDITSLKGIYRNRITRALLVFALSTLGGAAGNLIAIPSIAGRLFR